MHASRQKTLVRWLAAGTLLACASAPLQAAEVSGVAMDRIAAQLSLTPEQRATVERLFARWQPGREAHARPDVREEFLRQFAGDRFDADLLTLEANKRLREFETAIPRIAADLAELHRTLTPEQRAQLVKWTQERGTKRRWHATWWHREQ